MILLSEIDIGRVGCSFCEYGLIIYNCLSNVVLKARLSVMITSPYILYVI